MITVSVCMIVKNEEKILARCLDSLNGLYDELIIVDTGSTDNTRKIACSYTDKVYDFEWINDFSAARNFSFSKASCDYIYCADADEVLDEANRQRFMALKKAMLPEIEIVEMKYVNQLENGTVYNFDEEFRPKLYKRLRTFTFIEPVHETVRLDPVVFDSDIEIIHKPESVHSGRDISIFEREIKKGAFLSRRLTRMYALELLVSEDASAIRNAVPYFKSLLNTPDIDDAKARLCYIILAKDAALQDNASDLLKYSSKDIAMSASSEICAILGEFYYNKGDYDEAASWFINARDYTEPEICLKYHTDIPNKYLN